MKITTREAATTAKIDFKTHLPVKLIMFDFPAVYSDPSVTDPKYGQHI